MGAGKVRVHFALLLKATARQENVGWNRQKKRTLNSKYTCPLHKPPDTRKKISSNLQPDFRKPQQLLEI